MKIDPKILDWVAAEQRMARARGVEKAVESENYNTDSPTYHSIRQEYHRAQGRYSAFSDMLKKFAGGEN